jgi:hypothetical protein
MDAIKGGKKGKSLDVVAIVIGLMSMLAARVVIKRRRATKLPARAVIVSPRRSTSIARDGAVRSAQSAELSMPAEELERLWTADNLENLARTYWRFLTRVTLGLVRVKYGENERSIVLIARPLTLLRFTPPEYVAETDHGNVRWQIKDGLLVTRSGRGKGYLALDVSRDEDVGPDGRAKLRIEVEVANFYPSIASGFSMRVYEATQSLIHVLVTHAFLRSLASLHLAPSKVRRFSSMPRPTPRRRSRA